MQPEYFVYILTNKMNTVLYTGVTKSIFRRMQEHTNKRSPDSFTSRYRARKLVYFETYRSIRDAIRREKQIKAGSRWRKVALIESQNSEWKDLLPTIGPR